MNEQQRRYPHGSQREQSVTTLALTRFVGRVDLLSEIEQLLADGSLVTLTGIGGVGKTRIAFEALQRVEEKFVDGVCVVRLDTLDHNGAVAEAIALALRVPDQSNRDPLDKIIDVLHSRQLLLVLDNCEHVLAETAAVVSALHSANPNLKILATSRESLNVSGEQVVVIPPLQTPSDSALQDISSLESFEAVQLLIQRGQDHIPNFTFESLNPVSVVKLCQMLDGIPLAIELAATRLRSLSPEQLVERLDQRFHVLTAGSRNSSPRQQTLRALIDWSFELCTETEKILWRRLSVFVGSFDIDAAEQVCGFIGLEHAEVFDTLDRLVAKSVLVPERRSGRVRYRQLMMIREYGLERLAESTDESELRQRHRDYFVRQAEKMVQSWDGPGQAAALGEMQENHPNLIAAIEYSLATSSEVAAGAKLTSLLRYHWIAGGFLSSGRHYVESVLQLLPEDEKTIRAEMLWVAAWVALIQGDRERAYTWLTESAALSEVLNDRESLAHANQWLGEYWYFSGQINQAISLLQDALDQHTRAHNISAELITRFQLAFALVYAGQASAALQACQDAIAISDERGEQWARSYSYWISGICYWRLGEMERAITSARSALNVQDAFKDRICIALTIELLSWVASSTVELRSAAELALLADAVWNRLGTSVAAFGPDIAADSQRSAQRHAGVLSESEANQIRISHQNMDRDELIHQALSLAGVTGHRPTKTAATTPQFGLELLSKREHEVAQLLAQGKSNREIGELLFISRRTVDGHVERILAKLGVGSRTQVAIWMAAH